MNRPFAVPARLSPVLTRVQAYWQGLLRGSAMMPFWDDAKLSDLPDLTGRLFLVDVFQRPQRFRFGLMGDEVGRDLEGLFLDEAALRPPLDLIGAQCAATVETAAPTFAALPGGGQSGDPRPHTRLLLPMWGDGRVSMLLGVVDFG